MRAAIGWYAGLGHNGTQSRDRWLHARYDVSAQLPHMTGLARPSLMALDYGQVRWRCRWQPCRAARRWWKLSEALTCWNVVMLACRCTGLLRTCSSGSRPTLQRRDNLMTPLAAHCMRHSAATFCALPRAVRCVTSLPRRHPACATRLGAWRNHPRPPGPAIWLHRCGWDPLAR